MYFTLWDLQPTRWAQKNSHKSYKLGYNFTFRGYNPSYPFIMPFIGVITQFVTGRGPPRKSDKIIHLLPTITKYQLGHPIYDWINPFWLPAFRMKLFSQFLFGRDWNRYHLQKSLLSMKLTAQKHLKHWKLEDWNLLLEQFLAYFQWLC